MKYLVMAVFLAAAVPGLAHEQRDGFASVSVEELEKQAAELEEAVKQNPDDPQLYLRLGFTYARLKKPDEAQKAFEEVVRLLPEKAVAHYMLGLIYEKKDLKEKAVAAWKACLEHAQNPHMRRTARKHLHHLGTDQ